MHTMTDGVEPQEQCVHPLVCAGGQLTFSAAPWPSISEEAKHCVSKLLERNKNERATVAEILQHPWLAQHGVAALAPLEHVVVQRMRQARPLSPHSLLFCASNTQFVSGLALSWQQLVLLMNVQI